MVVTLDTDNPRALAALRLSKTASQWLKCHTPAGKRYGIPAQSQPGRYYLVNTVSCDCPDFQYRGGPCKHVAAVQLHVERVKASRQSEARHRWMA